MTGQNISARSVAASTQSQALNTLVFVYKQALGREGLALENIAPAKRPQRLPTVLDRNAVERLLTSLEGTPKLIAALLYGASLRLLVSVHGDTGCHRNLVYCERLG